MQPQSVAGPSNRAVVNRLAAHLAYERLSDLILVTRAKAGDKPRSRRSASGTRRASRRSRCICCAIPRTRATPPRSSLAKLVVRIRQFRGESQFSTVAAPARRQHLQGLRAGPWAARRTEPLVADERPARDGDPLAALTASETRRELGRCLAELPPAQATVVALKDAFDVGVRRDLGGDRPARRNGEVLRPPRPGLDADAAQRMTALLGKAEIEAIIPHRDPFLLVDEVVELDPGRARPRPQHRHRDRLRGTFPRQPDHARREDGRGARPVRRGRRAVSARERGKLVLFAGIDDVRFKRIVRPGETLSPLRSRGRARAGRQGQGEGDGGRRACRARDARRSPWARRREG